MNFLIKQKFLLKILSYTQSVIEKKATIPILSHIKIKAEKNKLHITATDLDLVIQETISAEVKSEGEWCVPANLFYDIIKRMEDCETIECILKDTKLFVLSKRLEFQIPTLSPTLFPDISEIPFENELKIKHETLEQLIDQTFFCMSNDEVRFYLNGIYIHLDDDKQLKCVATDMHRLAIAETEIEIKELPEAIIGRKTILELKKLLSGEQTNEVIIGLSSARIQFKFKNKEADITLSARLIEGAFPEYKNILNINSFKIASIKRDTLDKALDRISLVASDQNKSVKLIFDKNKLKITSHSKELGAGEEEVDIEYSGPEVSIQFNVFYLMDITRHSNATYLKFCLRGSYDAVLIKPDELESTRYIIMPLAG